MLYLTVIISSTETYHFVTANNVICYFFSLTLSQSRTCYIILLKTANSTCKLSCLAIQERARKCFIDILFYFKLTITTSYCAEPIIR